MSVRQARWMLMFLVLCVAGIGGCTRAFYRNSADREVNDILKEKDKYPEWKIEQYHVYADPRARFADTTNPDRPPMPPDDEAAWNLGPHPQKPWGKGTLAQEGTGYLEMIKLWDEQNRNTESRVVSDAKRPVQSFFDEALGAAKKGFVLKMDQAIELGVVNSTTYQTFREGLYRATLPVTQQRFNFAYQWAATSDWFRQYAGPLSDVGPQNNWTGFSNLSFSKLFATGALLTTDFANTTVFNFGANGGLTSASVINLNFAQPFLQGGGRAVTLEPLTQAERNLIYSIRSFARFREQYNIAVALGTALPTDLPAAIGASGTNPISVLAALNIASTDVSGGFVGYLSTLYRECDMAADKKLVQDLQRALKIIEAYQEGGMFSPLQVEQARSALLQAQNGVLNDVQFVTNGLDQFKLLLGVPTNLPLILDDTPARPITTVLDRYYEVIDDATNVQRLVETQESLEPQKLRATLQQIFVKDPLVRDTDFAKNAPASWADWAKAKDEDVRKRLESLGAQRRKLLDLKADLELQGQSFPAESARQMREAEFQSDLGTLEQLLRRYEAKAWEKLPKKEQQTIERVRLFRTVSAQAKAILVWARNDRFDVVSRQWPEIPKTEIEGIDILDGDVEIAQEKAVQAALRNRWDLMNARAQVVDAWRQIRVTANALLGVFTVEYNLTSQTPPDGVRPLVFSSASTNQELLLDFQLPLNRLAQRNAYRAAQINYQVARRALMFAEDNLAAQVRFDVRQLQLFAANYRIQKKLVHSLYGQLENNLEIIFAPTDPDALKGSSTATAGTQAALTNQYLGVLNQLNGSQTKMYDIWLSLYATRMQIFFDLERLSLDNRGVWTDESLLPSGSADNQCQTLPAPQSSTLPAPIGRILPAVQNGEPMPAAPFEGRPMFLPPRAVTDAAAGQR
jgi:Outer membrane efflux protein